MLGTHRSNSSQNLKVDVSTAGGVVSSRWKVHVALGNVKLVIPVGKVRIFCLTLI
jgi:hypothetical protein